MNHQDIAHTIDTELKETMAFTAPTDKEKRAGETRAKRARSNSRLAVMTTVSVHLMVLTVIASQYHQQVSCLQHHQGSKITVAPRHGGAVLPRLSPFSDNDLNVLRHRRRQLSYVTSLRMSNSNPSSSTPTSTTLTTATTSNAPSPPSPTSSSTSLGSSVVASSTDQRPSSSFASRLRHVRDQLRNRRRRFSPPSTTAPPTTDPSVVDSFTDSGSDLTVPTDRQWTKKNLGIALPALMGLLADPVLSMVDTAFVGRVSSIDLAALGVCTSLFHMAFTIFRASTVATTSLVGSAESIEEKRQITRISLGFAGVMGSLVMLALRFGGPAMLGSMGVSQSASPAMYKSACDYLFARCWAAPAVVGIVVAEGAFRGHHDNKTPLIAASVAALINLVLDPVLMFPLGMGMAGAAFATAFSQVGAAALYGWKLWKNSLLPQANDKVKINVSKVLKRILGANAACLAKNGSMLVFYTLATAFATRMGAAHVATHQVCLSVFWLVTMWLDSGSVSAQLLMAENMDRPARARSLTKYMTKFALTQGLAFSALVAAVGKFVPGVFTSDPTVIAYIAQCLPYLALQQTLVSVCLVLEGLAAGGNQFKFLASGTAAATVAGLWQMTKATSVIDIWASAVNVFFGFRLVNAVIGVLRVHMDIRRKQETNEVEGQQEGSMPLNELSDNSPASILQSFSEPSDDEPLLVVQTN